MWSSFLPKPGPDSRDLGPRGGQGVASWADTDEKGELPGSEGVLGGRTCHLGDQAWNLGSMAPLRCWGNGSSRRPRNHVAEQTPGAPRAHAPVSLAGGPICGHLSGTCLF